MNERGSIRTEDAYALGKMLDNSAWQQGNNRLPRLITPSDIDMVFDNAGRIIFGELSSTHAEWSGIDFGQKTLYENAIKGGLHCAVLCKHPVRPEDKRPINTRSDVTSFQLMIYDYGFVFSSVIEGNAHWQKYILDWFDNPVKLRRRLISKCGVPT